MKRIVQLDAILANQIAAGEVVERPSSVVKELIENSIDANATRIQIDIEKGGHELIRIRDNGHGIHPQDLSLAIHSHATSKIQNYQDLENVLSLGFRGEALASIAAVSRLKLASCAQDQESGFCILVEGGKTILLPAPIAHPVGTTIEVRHLFYNTPARRKFLRTERTEFNHIQMMLERLALSQFPIHFILKHNQKTILDLLPANTPALQEQRVVAVMGQAFIQEAIGIEFNAASIQLSGWINMPQYSRSQPDLQFFYINGRFVRDKLLSHAVRQAYSDVLFHGRHPAYVLYLQVDPKQVDVNVHPTKHEVRFRDSRTVHDAIVRGVQNALSQIKPKMEPVLIYSEVKTAEDEPAVSRSPVISATSAKTQSPIQQPMSLMVKEQMAHYAALHPVQAEAQEYPLGFAIAQLHEIYILAQNQQGLVMVDMHAAHERVLYEKLKSELAQKGIATQALLVPETLQLSQAEMQTFENYSASLQALGFYAEQVGPQSVAIREVPALLPMKAIGQLLRDILADVQMHETSNRVRDNMDSILGNLACRAAVWSKRRLSLPEMNALLRQMEHTPNSGVCNHGRPSIRQFSLSELDKLFLRGR